MTVECIVLRDDGIDSECFKSRVTLSVRVQLSLLDFVE